MQDNDGAVARLHNVLLLVVYRYGLLSSYRDRNDTSYIPANREFYLLYKLSIRKGYTFLSFIEN